MPAWLRKLLEDSSKPIVTNTIGADGRLVRVENIVGETPDVMPVLAQLCEQDRSVDQVFLCHPATRHIYKIEKEGGFCGYRNLQMLISYIRNAQADGFEHFVDGSPSIFKLQDLIEAAWDNGYNSHGRVETGGIKGTRKYIGTPEVSYFHLGRRAVLTRPRLKQSSPAWGLSESFQADST
jgi:zinc finger-containing ubiquitin peptidase 1